MEALPGWAAVAAWFLPLTHAVKLAAASGSRSASRLVWIHSATALLMALAVLLLGRQTIK